MFAGAFSVRRGSGSRTRDSERLSGSADRARSGRRWLFLLLVCLIISSLSTVQAEQFSPVPRLVIGPPGAKGFRDLFEHASDWPQARAGVGAILLADHNLLEITDEELRQW